MALVQQFSTSAPARHSKRWEHSMKRYLTVMAGSVLSISPAIAQSNYETYTTQGPWTLRHDNLSGGCAMLRETEYDKKKGLFGITFTGHPNRFYAFVFSHAGLGLEPQKIRMSAKFGDLGEATWDGTGNGDLLTVTMPLEKTAAVQQGIEQALGKTLHFDLLEQASKHHIIEINGDDDFGVAFSELVACGTRGPRTLQPSNVKRCNAGPHMVFFDADSHALTQKSISILRDIVLKSKADCGDVVVHLDGHTDRSGTEAASAALSQRMAETVAEYLVAQGVPKNRLSWGSFGESQPLVYTADGIREPQNRRVEITFSFPGW